MERQQFPLLHQLTLFAQTPPSSSSSPLPIMFASCSSHAEISLISLCGMHALAKRFDVFTSWSGLCIFAG